MWNMFRFLFCGWNGTWYSNKLFTEIVVTWIAHYSVAQNQDLPQLFMGASLAPMLQRKITPPP